MSVTQKTVCALPCGMNGLRSLPIRFRSTDQASRVDRVALAMRENPTFTEADGWCPFIAYYNEDGTCDLAELVRHLRRTERQRRIIARQWRNV
jgi:hypothetical protein